MSDLKNWQSLKINFGKFGLNLPYEKVKKTLQI